MTVYVVIMCSLDVPRASLYVEALTAYVTVIGYAIANILWMLGIIFQA